MPPHLDTSNPYSSLAQDSETSLPTRRFRWRIIPATLLAIFGLPVLFSGFANFYLAMRSAMESGETVLTERPHFALALAIFTTGGFLLASSLMWWRGRWKIAAITTIAAFSVIWLMAILNPT